MNPVTIPDFALSSWYADPKDPRCPLDATLDALTVEPPSPAREREPQTTAIVLTLSNAFQSGHIILKYTGVTKHTVTCYACDQGFGTWRRDELSVTDGGRILHHITWASPENDTRHWIIEADEIGYEWLPTRPEN